MLLLSRLPANTWADPIAIEKWIVERHPFWKGQKSPESGIATFLLGVAYSMRLLQTTKSDKNWLVRLSPLGRWVMRFTDKPPAMPGFKQTLLMQPNLEILAYRQGLTPELIAGLSKFATWKSLGAACTLLLEPNSVYRALEMGETYASIVQLLEGHGMKALPTAVLDSLRTWSSKRERISVFTAGAIFEFSSAVEMNDAIARGLPAQRLTDKLAIVANEKVIDYRHYRLTGTRDYTLPPERCVEVELDGVTLSVDLSRSDLMLDTELQRFAEPVDAKVTNNNRSQYRITPATILARQPLTLCIWAWLSHWFANHLLTYPIRTARRRGDSAANRSSRANELAVAGAWPPATPSSNVRTAAAVVEEAGLQMCSAAQGVQSKVDECFIRQRGRGSIARVQDVLRPGYFYLHSLK